MKKQYVSKVTLGKVKKGDRFYEGDSYNLVQEESGVFTRYFWLYNEDIAFFVSPETLKENFEEVRDEQYE